MEDSGAGSYVNYTCLLQEVSEGKNIIKLLRDSFCFILTKSVAVFCPCPETFFEAKLKTFRLKALEEETPRL